MGRSSGPWRSWSALGLGKVASDLGHGEDAQAWLLAALDLARPEALPELAEALSALAAALTVPTQAPYR